VGTVPVLFGVGAGMKRAAARFGPSLEAVLALSILALGAASIATRFSVVLPRMASASISGAMKSVEAIGEPPPSACHR
jgi:hypothetical protein